MSSLCRAHDCKAVSKDQLAWGWVLGTHFASVDRTWLVENRTIICDSVPHWCYITRLSVSSDLCRTLFSSVVVIY